ncbi:hypothetical protein HOLleu_29856 [Holothuria leucospilota]|uniref:Uncharacterized protein n=1 Tax=Holothuria leucospilota TaxID=206669 RepID=A0A9Q1BJI6_HOLLE|nr:hypothetical protein HOLleu_29856 [Holothuria leucospilota]
MSITVRQYSFLTLPHISQWSGSGQAVVRQWSGSGQAVVRGSGQAVVRGRAYFIKAVETTYFIKAVETSNVGGYMGLLCGASLITLVEILDCIVMTGRRMLISQKNY